MNLKRYASAIKAFSECLESTRALYGLAGTNRFAVEQQREDEIREMRETIREPVAGGAGGSGRPQAEGDASARSRTPADVARPTAISRRPKCCCRSAAPLPQRRHRGGDRQWKAAVERQPEAGRSAQQSRRHLHADRTPREAEREMKLAEKSGFRVNPQFKEDLKKASARR